MRALTKAAKEYDEHGEERRGNDQSVSEKKSKLVNGYSMCYCKEK